MKTNKTKMGAEVEAQTGNAPRMTRSGQMKLLKEFFWRMQRVCESSHEWDRFFDHEVSEERDHQKHRPDSVGKGPLGIKDADRLFAVQHILQHMGAGSKHDWKTAPDAADIFSVRLACFQGYALFKKFEKEIRAEFKADEVRQYLDTVDYAELAGMELL